MKNNEEAVYRFYRDRLRSNFDIGDRLDETGYDLTLFAQQGNPYSDQPEHIFEDHDGIFHIQSPFASYRIGSEQRRIWVEYDDDESVRSTIFHLPAAALAMGEGNLLLHASALYTNGRVIAFCGPKGMGKSTLISLLGQFSPIFSDDTMFLSERDSQVCAYAQAGRLRLTKETCQIHSSNPCLYEDAPKSIQGKAYMNASEIGAQPYVASGNTVPILSTIVVIHRHVSPDFRIRPVDSLLEKTSLLMANCIGILFLTTQSRKRLCTGKTFQQVLSTVRFLHLYLPNRLACLKTQSPQIFASILRA